jgi:very-short-patch-repair endonuclease
MITKKIEASNLSESPPRTCFECGIRIAPKDQNHIYRCSVLDRSTVKYNQICHEYGGIITEYEMRELYLNKGWALPDFKAEMNLPYSQTKFLLEYFGVKSRDIKTANSAPNRSTKYSETCINRYGTTNVSKLESVKTKKRETFSINYGVDNIWKSESFRLWLNAYMESTYGKKSLPNRYGNMTAYWADKDADFRRLATDKMGKGYKIWLESLSPEQLLELNARKANTLVGISSSRLELFVEQTLIEMDIPHKRQKWIAGKSFDFLILGTNIILEINGDYWHANPRKYLSSDSIKYPNRVITAKDKWEEDKAKTILAEKYGYRVIDIWEDEINKNVSQLEKLIADKLIS